MSEEHNQTNQTEQNSTDPNPNPPADPAANPNPDTSLLTDPNASKEETFDAEKLTLAEGFEKGAHWEEFTNLAKEAGLSQANAQKLVNLYSEAQKANLNSWAEQNAKWQNEVKADSELGGTKLDTVKQTISKLLDNTELSDPKFRGALHFTGAANNPAIIRTLYRWAQKLTEGGSVAGDPAARNADGTLANQQRPSVAQAVYGSEGPRSGGPFR